MTDIDYLPEPRHRLKAIAPVPNVYLLVEHVCGYESVLCVASSIAICKREAQEHRLAKPYITEHSPIQWYEGDLTKPYKLYTDHGYFRIYEMQVMDS